MEGMNMSSGGTTTGNMNMNMNMSMMGMTNNGNNTMMMQTYFQSSIQTTILFQNWATTTFADYMLVLFIIYVVSFCTIVLGFMTPRIVARVGRKNRTKGLHKMQRVVFGCLSALRAVMTYLLMLVVMTYNIGIFVAIILGSGTAYYIFADIMCRDPIQDTHH